MNNEQISTKQALLTLGILVAVIGSSLVIPAKWLGIKPKQHTKLDLSDLTPIGSLREDIDNNSNPDWRDLAIASLGTSTKEAMAKAKIDPKAQARLSDPDNITGSFSKNIYMASAYLQKEGKTSAEDQAKLITSLITQEETKITVTEYREEDITIANTDTNADKKKYGNTLGSLMQKADAYKIGEGDLEIVQAYSTSKDASLLTSFSLKKDKLDGLIKSMQTIPVPPSAVGNHLLALNTVSAYRTALDSFSKMESDPIRSALSLKNYKTIILDLFMALTAMREYFTMQNIIFTNKESGYIFDPGYTTSH